MSYSNNDSKYLVCLQQRYQRASKKERSTILDEFVQTTGYHRKHASALLSGKRGHVNHPIRRSRSLIYTGEDAANLEKLSNLFDNVCSKRLVPAIRENLPRLKEDGDIQISDGSYERLLRISPATVDRLLVRHHRRGVKPRHGTKPGTLLKSKIPIRTFADWDEKRVGFLEIDLVDHSGGVERGEFAQTLDATDILSGWTENVAVPTKAQVFVFAALKRIRKRLPFPLLGIDSDSGAEFINDQLYRYCLAEKITFTRARPYRKNDNPFVEQKNWSVVRRLVGYGRYDTKEQVDLLNRIYEVSRLYTNFYLPVMKLKEKTRVGSKVKKIYDQPKTPYQRILDNPNVDSRIKENLKKMYYSLNLVGLKRQLDTFISQLKPTPLS